MNEAVIRQWYDVFKNNKELVEIRILDPKAKSTYSGYFTDIEKLLAAIKPFDHCAIYFTLNDIDGACYSREQHDKMVKKPKSTTSDREIVSRKWCLIDIDCEKPSDTNSTDSEKELAKKVVNNVYKYLMDEGFEKPIVCDSGNGYHLLYRMEMESNEGNDIIMKKFLATLDMFFSTEKVKIDTTTFNASRICKLYGTFSRKGSDTADRPQRLSYIYRLPTEVKVTPNEYFQKVASYFPEPEQKDKYNAYGSISFDLDDFLTRHNIGVTQVIETPSYTKYVLEECPFNSAHRSPDSAVFKMKNGGFGFKCFHASCAAYTFRDFRLHFEPNAYDSQNYYEYNFKKRYYGTYPPEHFEPKKETDDLGKKWLHFSDIKKFDATNIVPIPTGILSIDRKIGGLNLGECTILSGINGSGKSILLNQIMLNAVQRGFKASIWSGELSAEWLKMWIMQCAAGKSNVIKKPNSEHAYYVSGNAYPKIENWLNGKLFIYNNNYGSRFEQLVADIGEFVDMENVNLVIVDNCMAVDLDARGGDKLEKQKYFILTLVEMARKKNIHIVVVCHPRKEIGNGLIRKESISGSGDLTNAVQNCFLMHRCSEDFFKRATEFWGKKKVEELREFDNVLEICKSRSTGVVDFLAGLYYEEETKRYKNSIAENIIYGWCEPSPEFIEQQFTDDNSFLEDNPFPLAADEPPF